MLIQKIILQTLKQLPFYEVKHKITKICGPIMYTTLFHTLVGSNKNIRSTLILNKVFKQYYRKFYYLTSSLYEILLLEKGILKKKFELLKKIKHYKGYRLESKLPLNGQRTHTNAQTIKKTKY